VAPRDETAPSIDNEQSPATWPDACFVARAALSTRLPLFARASSRAGVTAIGVKSSRSTAINGRAPMGLKESRQSCFSAATSTSPAPCPDSQRAETRALAFRLAASAGMRCEFGEECQDPDLRQPDTCSDENAVLSSSAGDVADRFYPPASFGLASAG